MRENRVRTAGASSGATPASRSTASSVACMVEPVINIVGGRLARCTRCSAFCKAIAAIPAKPVSSAAGLSASANGPNRTASMKKAASRTTSDGEHDAKHRQIAMPQCPAGKACDRDHCDELGQRQDLVEDAVTA